MSQESDMANYEQVFALPRSRVEWTLDECILFLEQHERFNNKWLQIARFFPQKSQSDVKNHFYILLKRYMGNIQKDTYIFDGHLDLIHCYYIIRHILHFFHELGKSKKKDHLRMLVFMHKLTEPMALSYFQKFVLMYPLLDKIGWKKYYDDATTYAPILLQGYYFPNRILPSVSTASASCLSHDEKINFITNWTLDHH